MLIVRIPIDGPDRIRGPIVKVEPQFDVRTDAERARRDHDERMVAADGFLVGTRRREAVPERAGYATDEQEQD